MLCIVYVCMYVCVYIYLSLSLSIYIYIYNSAHPSLSPSAVNAKYMSGIAQWSSSHEAHRWGTMGYWGMRTRMSDPLGGRQTWRAPRWTTANLRTRILDFRGLDSGIILMSRVWSLLAQTEFAGKFESTILSMDNLSRETERNKPAVRAESRHASQVPQDPLAWSY